MALIRLRVCAGWSEPLLVAHTTLLEISCRGSNNEIHIQMEKHSFYKYIWAIYVVFVLFCFFLGGGGGEEGRTNDLFWCNNLVNTKSSH